MRRAVVKWFITGGSWSSYWSTLISAVVEDATPDEVVLTFSEANSAVYTDFTIAGFTISSGSWCGSVLTLVLSEEVLYGESLIINHVPTSKTHAVTNNTLSYHYVDVFAGDNGDDGSITSPWLTVAYADTQLTTNAPLKLKYPDGTWHRSPAYWHTLRAFFPMVEGVDDTKVYDCANGLIGTIVGAVKYSGTKYAGISLESNGYVNLGTGVLGIGTGDQTILASVYPSSDAAAYVIFSNGAIGPQKGTALYYNIGKANYQMRSVATSIPITSDAAVFDSEHATPQVIVATNKRNDANGMKLFVEGESVASPVSTVGLGTDDLTLATAKTLIGARDQSGTIAYYLTAPWIKELRIYSSALDDTNAIAASQEAMASRDVTYPFESGQYLTAGIEEDYYTSVKPIFSISNSYTGPFFPVTQTTYTGRPIQYIGNIRVLPLNINKCNGTIPPCAGELNWLMCHIVPNQNGLQYFAKSHNGINWEYISQLPGAGIGIALGAFYVENNDPTDYNNIHLIASKALEGKVYESHPLNAQFTEWSDLVLIFSISPDDLFRPDIQKIGATYYMFYTRDIAPNRHLAYATCTFGPVSAVNDWTETEPDDWLGKGNIESCNFFNLGGSNWVIIYLDVTTFKYYYATSADDCMTFSAGMVINSLSAPLQYNVGAIKME